MKRLWDLESRIATRKLVSGGCCGVVPRVRVEIMMKLSVCDKHD